MVGTAVFARAVAPLFAFYTARDRRFVNAMQDQSIERGSSAKELGDWRDAANFANGRHGREAGIADERAFFQASFDDNLR